MDGPTDEKEARQGSEEAQSITDQFRIIDPPYRDRRKDCQERDEHRRGRRNTVDYGLIQPENVNAGRHSVRPVPTAHGCSEKGWFMTEPVPKFHISKR